MFYLVKSILRDIKNYYFPKKYVWKKILADKEYYISKHNDAKKNL